MKIALLIAAVAPLFAAVPALAQPAAQPVAQTPAQLVPAQSEIVFVSRQMGVPVEGRFGKFAAQVSLNPAHPETGSVAMTIDMASARFGVSEVDAEVAKPAWFNAAKFPQASFQSTAVKAAGAGRFDVSGKLTVKGVTQDAVVPVALAQAGGVSTATGTFTIKRQDFKIGDGEWNDTSLVANEVKVRFKLVFTGMQPLP